VAISDEKNNADVLVTASGLKLEKSPPPPAEKPRLRGPISEPSAGLKALGKLPPSASGLSFVEEPHAVKGLEFVRKGLSGGMRVIQEIPASSDAQTFSLPSEGNIIVLQVPANSQGVKVIQLPSFSTRSVKSRGLTRYTQPSFTATGPEEVVKETPPPETASDKGESHPAASLTSDGSKNDDKDKKAKDSDSSPMVLIPAGYFNMGSPDEKGNTDEHPQHKVWVEAFYMDKYLTTFDQYDKFCDDTGRNPISDNGWGRGDNPAINLMWEDADAFCKWAGKRLPTEAEWEKAARGGTDTAYFFGDNENLLKDYAWYADNSGDKIKTVGQKKPNPFGLYDILGDVWEWMSDWYGKDYYRQSPAQNPTGPESGTYRVLRGGSFNVNADYLQSAHRGIDRPDHQDTNDGCRCAKSQ